MCFIEEFEAIKTTLTSKNLSLLRSTYIKIKSYFFPSLFHYYCERSEAEVQRRRRKRGKLMLTSVTGTFPSVLSLGFSPVRSFPRQLFAR